MDRSSMIIFLYLANCIYLASYGVRDVLLLRILAVVAMIVFMPYYGYYFEKPLFDAIGWNLAFMAINLVWIVKIFRERKPPRMTPDQRKLYELAFRNCSPREMLRLLETAEWRSARAGDVLVTERELCQELYVLHTGIVSARRGARELAKLLDGDFVGETSFLSGDPSTTTAIAVTPLRYVAWRREDLQQLFDRRVDLKSALNVVIGSNLIEKLSAAENRLPELSLAPSS